MANERRRAVLTQELGNGAQPAALYDLMDGKPVGTKFLAREEKA